MNELYQTHNAFIPISADWDFSFFAISLYVDKEDCNRAWAKIQGVCQKHMSVQHTREMIAFIFKLQKLPVLLQSYFILIQL